MKVKILMLALWLTQLYNGVDSYDNHGQNTACILHSEVRGRIFTRNINKNLTVDIVWKPWNAI